MLILPFRNDSKAPGLEWIGEAFSEVLGQRMQSPSIFVISREDRLYAFDRVGIPASAQPASSRRADILDFHLIYFSSAFHR